MTRLISKALLALIVAAALFYLGDFAVWKVRTFSGGGMGKITVTRTVVAAEKGNKEEYYNDGTSDVPCSQSLFPQAGGGACWWLERHKDVQYRP